MSALLIAAKKEAAVKVCDAKCKAPGGGGSGGATDGDGEGTKNPGGATDGDGEGTKHPGGATDGDGKGTKNPTGTPATGSGNQRVVETNHLVFVVWVLVTLTIGSF